MHSDIGLAPKSWPFKLNGDQSQAHDFLKKGTIFSNYTKDQFAKLRNGGMYRLTKTYNNHEVEELRRYRECRN